MRLADKNDKTVSEAIREALAEYAARHWSIGIDFCGGFTLGAMVYGFGGVVRAVVVIARNSEQNTNALNRIAQAQTGVAEALPERRIRPLK